MTKRKEYNKIITYNKENILNNRRKSLEFSRKIVLCSAVFLTMSILSSCGITQFETDRIKQDIVQRESGVIKFKFAPDDSSLNTYDTTESNKLNQVVQELQKQNKKIKQIGVKVSGKSKMMDVHIEYENK